MILRRLDAWTLPQRRSFIGHDWILSNTSKLENPAFILQYWTQRKVPRMKARLSLQRADDVQRKIGWLMRLNYFFLNHYLWKNFSNYYLFVYYLELINDLFWTTTLVEENNWTRLGQIDPIGPISKTSLNLINLTVFNQVRPFWIRLIN